MRRILATLALSSALALLAAPAAQADVDDFAFERFDAVYELGTDEAGHSTLRVTETLVAQFPEHDQNRGIRRELVDWYDGHPTGLELVSVTDETGVPRGYESERDDGFLILTIAGDDYVHGRQAYVITYTQRDVTRYFADTRADEFYWDVNGTGWRQPFGEVTATVELAEPLRARLTGGVDAVWGVEGAADPASITATDTGFEFSASDLGPRENLSFAIGFEPGTFTPRDGSFGASAWPGLSLAASVLGLLSAVGAIVLRATRLRDSPGRPVIVPEYLPPRDAGLLLASVVTHRTGKAVPAMVLSLAVSGRLRIVEVPPPRFRHKPSYELEFVQTAASGRGAWRQSEPTEEEKAALHALFGEVLTPGERRSLATADAKVVKRFTALQTTARQQATKGGYRRRMPVGAVVAVGVAAFVAMMLALLFGAVALGQAHGGAWPAVTMVVGVLAFVFALMLIARRPLSPTGAELRDHVKGMDVYIRLAEAERLRYLHSPQGASRLPVATDDREQVLHLTERLLPWAILLGREKEWSAELARLYEGTGESPAWYSGSHAFSAAVFASSIGSVTSSVSSSYSSSSGGSSGGASSGGGGGGGGGGGV